jgi:tetratricopeptide (TPR) repeat protein
MAAMWRYGTARGESAEWHELYARILWDLSCPPSLELGEAWFGFAILARVSGEWNNQTPVYRRAIEIYAECGSATGQSWCEGNLVIHLTVTRRYREALRTAESVIARPNDDPWNNLLARSDRAMLLAILGRSEEAVPIIEGIFRERMTMNEPGEIAKAHLELAIVLFHAGRESDALALMEPGIQRARASGIQDFVLQNLLARAEFGLAVEGEVPNHVLAEAEAIATRIGDRHAVVSLQIFRALSDSSPAQLAETIDDCLQIGFVQEILSVLLWLSARGNLEAQLLAVDVAAATDQDIPHRAHRFVSTLEPTCEGWETRLAIFSSRLRRMTRVQ